jgi:DNA-binding NarL/FixJ family response regulator
METQELNLYIVDDNKSMVYALKHYLNERFGEKISISTFFDGETCLQNIRDETDVVILDYFLGERNGNEILKCIKQINPRTEVIMLSSNEDLETAIESYKLGANNYVLKGSSAWRKISRLVKSFFEQPINSIKRFGFTKFVSILFVGFLTTGAAIGLVFKNNIVKKWKRLKK